MLYEFTNREKEVVQACFRVGNYHNLRDLPDELGPNQITQALRDKIDKANQVTGMIT